MRGRERWKTAAAALLLAAWFLARTWRGLLVYFQGDDAMNLYQAWILAPWKIALANLTPFTAVYRPFGTAVYRSLYAIFGWHPLPFRILVYALMLLNIGLLYRLARMLTGSAEIGVLAALIGSYHPRLIDLYLNGGAIYDVLCYTFSLLALIAYMGGRPALFLIAYVLALNSKEMAAAIPLLALIYDGIYRKRAGSVAAWTALGATGLAFVIKKSAPAFAHVPDYWLHVSVRQFFATTRPLLSQLWLLPENALNTTESVLIFALMWAIAAARRSKPLLFAAAFATLAPLPINFITYRGFFVMYLPLAGWAIFLATSLMGVREWFWRRHLQRHAAGSLAPDYGFAILLFAGLLFSVQSNDPYRSFDRIDPSQANLRTLAEALPQAVPGRVLLLHDPFPRDVWDPVFVVRMHYRNPDLMVDRVAGPSQQPSGRRYDLVLDYDGQHYNLLREP